MFDPYRKWLGIPPKDQPPNHYRLLGLELYEPDLDVIEGAADRQMGFIRQYQSGEHAADAARILNELAMARLCLLKPVTKAAYDEKLRQQLAPSEPEFPEESLSFSDGPSISRPSEKRKKKQPTSKSKVSPQILIGGGVGALCLILVAVFVLSSGGPKPKLNQSDPANPTVAKTESPQTNDKTKANVTPTNPASTGDSSSNPILWKETKLVTTPAGPPVDLLKLVNIERDVATGKWEKTNTALISERRSGLYLPSKLPEDYQLRLAMRRIDGTDTLSIGFMMGGRQGVAVFDGWRATISALLLDNRDTGENGTTRRRGLFQGTSTSTIVLTVHPGHFHASFDGKEVMEWFGDAERLFIHPFYQMACRECPFIVTVDAT